MVFRHFRGALQKKQEAHGMLGHESVPVESTEHILNTRFEKICTVGVVVASRHG